MNATRKVDLAVVGLGAMGAAAVYHASRYPGVRVVGIDRFSPPHDQGSTHGETRITRQAVGEGPAFAPFVRRSHEIWKALERRPGELLVACGCLVIGPPDGRSGDDRKPEFMSKTLDVAKQFGIDHAVLCRDEIRDRYPQFTNVGSGDTAYYEPGGGFVYPERCIEAQLAQAAGPNIELLTDTTVGGISQENGTVAIATSSGRVLADRAIVAAGAWTAGLLGGPFDKLLDVTRQVLYWCETDRPDDYTVERCPVYIRMVGNGKGNTFYGFPTPPGSAGVKVATEQYAAFCLPNEVSRQVSREEFVGFHARYISRNMAGISDRLIKARACLYTSTKLLRDGAPSSNFLIDKHPAMDRVHVISACSGHGFKHSTAIGEAVVQSMAEGRSALDLSPFALRNFV